MTFTKTETVICHDLCGAETHTHVLVTKECGCGTWDGMQVDFCDTHFPTTDREWF